MSDNGYTKRLFIPHARKAMGVSIYKFSIAFIRDNDDLKFKNKGTFDLKDIEDKYDIVEVRRFFIDCTKDKYIVCMESSGAINIPDINHLFKVVGKEELSAINSCDVHVPVKDTIAATKRELSNVLEFNIKVKPENFEKIESSFKNRFLQGMDFLNKIYKPKELTIHAFFKKKRSGTLQKFVKNEKAVTMFEAALDVFEKDSDQTRYYDKFDVVYTNGNGVEDTFKLLKNKYSNEYTVDDNFKYDVDSIFELVKNDFKKTVDEINS